MPRWKARRLRGRRTIKQRILTGVIALPLLILFIYFAPPLLFHSLVVVVASIGLWEFFSMGLPEERILERYLATGSGGLLLALAAAESASFPQGVLTFLFLGFSVHFLLRFGDLKTVVLHLGLVSLGWLYLPLLLGHLSLLRLLPFGREWIFLVLLVVMAGDTAAYFFGSSFGKRKLYPAISPNKSVEGAIGGLVGSLAGAFVARITFFPEISALDAVFFGLVVGSAGQVGDLFESMLKRSFGVKDSGTIIPGHGGILDRLDSLLFAFPLAYYYALWVVG